MGRSELILLDTHLLLRSVSRKTASTKSPLGSDHAVFIESLPPIHKDPFDRILVAQANVEGITISTHDTQVEKYPVPIRLV